MKQISSDLSAAIEKHLGKGAGINSLAIASGVSSNTVDLRKKQLGLTENPPRDTVFPQITRWSARRIDQAYMIRDNPTDRQVAQYAGVRPNTVLIYLAKCREYRQTNKEPAWERYTKN